MKPWPSNKPKAVLCLSGGMDSCVCSALTAQNHDLYALHVSYGQRTESRELHAAREIARLTGAKDFLHLKVDFFRRIGGSALTDDSIPVPDAAPISDPISDPSQSHPFADPLDGL